VQDSRVPGDASARDSVAFSEHDDPPRVEDFEVWYEPSLIPRRPCHFDALAWIGDEPCETWVGRVAVQDGARRNASARRDGAWRQLDRRLGRQRERVRCQGRADNEGGATEGGDGAAQAVMAHSKGIKTISLIAPPVTPAGRPEFRSIFDGR
jgi:hypothetical protein